MKISNNTSLNELFRQAASESVESDGNVPTQNDVERLLRNSNMPSVPVAQSIQQTLYRHLLSSPLKIGMTAMTTAACIALGIFALTPKSLQQNAPITQTPTQKTYSYAETPRLVETSASKPTTPSRVTHFATPATLFGTVPATPIATADSLHPVDATPEQLAKLGIVLEDNGDIDFYTKGGKKESINHYGLPPTWGLRVHFNNKGAQTQKDFPNLQILTRLPKLITETNGAKRLFSFQSDEGNSNNHSNTEIIKNFPNNNGKMDVLPVFDNDSEIDIATQNDGTSNNLSMRRIVKRTDNETLLPNNPSLDSIVNQAMKLAIDSLKNFQSSKINIEETDSESGIKNPKIFHTTIESFDSEKIGTPGKVAIFEKTINISDSASISSSNQRAMLDSALNRALKVAIDSLQNAPNIHIPDIDSEFNSFMNDSLDLSNLIPIRVVNNKNPEHPNELIFWYEPTPEVEAALPALPSNPAGVETEQSKNLSVSVYPNPTSGAANIHYSIQNGHEMNFAVYNLLGQKLLDAGSVASGTGDAPLDLSSLDAGMYLLVTTTPDGERDVQRVVVAK